MSLLRLQLLISNHQWMEIEDAFEDFTLLFIEGKINKTVNSWLFNDNLMVFSMQNTPTFLNPIINIIFYQWKMKVNQLSVWKKATTNVVKLLTSERKECKSIYCRCSLLDRWSQPGFLIWRFSFNSHLLCIRDDDGMSNERKEIF